MATPLAEREWLRPREAAAYLGVSLSTLYSWRRRGLVRFYRMGPRAVVVRREELDALATRAGPESEGDGGLAAHLRALNDSMRAKYGATGDSVAVIREARESRGR